MMFLKSGHAKVKVGVCGSYELAEEGTHCTVTQSTQLVRTMWLVWCMCWSVQAESLLIQHGR